MQTFFENRRMIMICTKWYTNNNHNTIRRWQKMYWWKNLAHTDLLLVSKLCGRARRFHIRFTPPYLSYSSKTTRMIIRNKKWCYNHNAIRRRRAMDWFVKMKFSKVSSADMFFLVILVSVLWRHSSKMTRACQSQSESTGTPSMVTGHRLQECTAPRWFLS